MHMATLCSCLRQLCTAKSVLPGITYTHTDQSRMAGSHVVLSFSAGSQGVAHHYVQLSACTHGEAQCVS